MKTKLLSFEITLNEEGSIETTLEALNPLLLRNALDEYDPEYENTEVLCSMLRNMIRETVGVQDMLVKLLKH